LCAEHIGQEFLNFIFFVEFGSVDDILEFAFVEPEAVAFWASVYEEFWMGMPDDDFLHFFQADGAVSGFFGRVWVDVEGIDEAACMLRVVEEEFEFASIEPDAATFGAVVDFDVGQLKSNHRVFANGAVHDCPVVK